MATDVDVQYFSHLNGLVLDNNWGDLIRLLDKALVTGIDFTQITAASIDAQGDVHITLFAAHNAMLFQVVELSGFTPNALNQKYRIKGVPSTTKLILKPKDAITGTSISVVGNGKLAPLGYDIVFRDADDVKRVYRAKNPTAQHPFIRVDESLTSPDGATGVYTPTYAKYAMVGLLEHMEHIDDFENPNVLQLPFDPANPAKNWNIAGTETGVVRGWSRWYWRRSGGVTNSYIQDASSPTSGAARFTIVGNADAFYFLRCHQATDTEANKQMSGCGMFNSALPTDLVPNWFLFSTLTQNTPSNGFTMRDAIGSCPLGSSNPGKFFTCKHSLASRIAASVDSFGIVPDPNSGNTTLYTATSMPALEVPLYDADKFLRGSLRHVCYFGKTATSQTISPTIEENSMYIIERAYIDNSAGAFAFYLGELE